MLTILTLKQLATRVVVRDELPHKDLVPTLKRGLEAVCQVARQLYNHWGIQEDGKTGRG